MALVYVGGAEASGNSAAFTVSLAALTGGADTAAQAGDLVVVVCGFVGTANGDPGVSTAGYTEEVDLWANDTRDSNMSVSWKLMGGTPDTSVSINGSGTTTNGSAAVVHVWRGVDQTTPLDAATTSITGTNAVAPNSPAITTVTDGAVVLSAGLWTGAAADTSVTAPAGYTNQVDISIDPGSAVIAAVASKLIATAGTEDAAVWTGVTSSTSDSWAAVALAIRPATIVVPPAVTPTRTLMGVGL